MCIYSKLNYLKTFITNNLKKYCKSSDAKATHEMLVQLTTSKKMKNKQ